MIGFIFSNPVLEFRSYDVITVIENIAKRLSKIINGGIVTSGGGGASLAQIQTELDQRFGQEDVNIISTYPKVQPASGAANTFGAWVEIVADVGATPIVIMMVQCLLNTVTGGGETFELEIGTGAAAAETRAFGLTTHDSITTNVGELNGHIFFPLRRIAASSRLSCRCRFENATRTLNVVIMYRIGA